MSAEEEFFKRWSRRKREAAETDIAPPAAQPDEAAGTPAQDQGTETPEPAFDPASLPPIESISAVSDVTAFLRAGVPADLTRAALRRVWTADPAIRNFVGLAENAWDFTNPDAMPGFGPLEATEDVRRMIANIVDRMGRAVQAAASESAKVSQDSDDPRISKQEDGSAAPATALTAQHQERPAENLDTKILLQDSRENIATQRELAQVAKDRPSRRGRHGGALPRN